MFTQKHTSSGNVELLLITNYCQVSFGSSKDNHRVMSGSGKKLRMVSKQSEINPGAFLDHLRFAVGRETLELIR